MRKRERKALKRGSVGASERESVRALKRGWFGNFITALKADFEADYCGAFAWELGIKCQRIEAIVAIGKVENADADFYIAARKAIADEAVELPEIVAGLVWRIAGIALHAPDGL